MTPARFTRKPRTVEAIRYDGSDESVGTIHGWLDGAVIGGHPGPMLKVQWHGQLFRAFVGDWIALDEDGRLHVIEPEDLAEDYEPEGGGE